MEYQLIVIGGGPGGYTAALRAASYGVHTALVESAEVGGTCLNRGCVPTKALLHASEVYRESSLGDSVGVHADAVSVKLDELFAYKRSVVETQRSGVEGLLKRAKVDVIKGRGRIIAPGQVEVETITAPEQVEERSNTESGQVEVTDAEGSVTTLTAERILCATGSIPARPPIPGLDLEGVLTSDELLEGSDHLPASIVIMGGGVIGCEFASFYADLGVEVIILEGLDRLLPMLDKELGQGLTMILKKQGVHVSTKSMVDRVERDETGLTVHFTCKGKTDAVSAETVLCAIGRSPYLDGLFGEGLQPEMDGRRILVNERFETGIPGVYAIGDVSSKIQLAHVAQAQATAFADQCFGSGSVLRQDIVPSCIYCRPEIASVGLTEAEAKEAGIPVKTGKCVMGGNARTVIAQMPRSFMKIIAHAETGEILGGHLMCSGSTDMISEISLAIARHMTVSEMLSVMRPHPTFEEALTDALTDLKGKLES